VAEERFEEATNLFIKIKTQYGDRVPGNILKDKEAFKAEIKRISENFFETLDNRIKYEL
jgi:hypothetical protein